jgi:L-xylulokinase
MGQFILGIDAGGTAVKAAVCSLDGTETGIATRTLRPLTPAPGHAERDCELLWRSVCAVIRAALADAGVQGGDIAAIGITGYGNGLYLIDDDGRPVANGVLSSDVRSTEIVEAWRAQALEPEEIALVGKPFWPGSSLSLLAWFMRHRPTLLERAAAALPCKDYLRFKLTGAVAAEVTDQSSASLLANASRARDGRALGLVGLEPCARLLAPLIEPTAVAGMLTPEAAAAAGLRAGTPVSAGCCDNLAVMYGTGVVGLRDFVVMSGTWGLHQVILDRVPSGGPIAFVDHSASPGEWLCIDGSPASASSFEWFVSTFLRGQGSEASAEAAYAAAIEAFRATAADDPPVYFLPFLNGAFDDLRARGGLVGLSTWHQLGHAVRAVLEGIAFEHRRHFDRLVAACGPAERARFAGGPVRSPEWCEIFAAVLRIPLDVPRGVELGARGAAILAAAACGLAPDIASAVRAMTSISYTIEPDGRLQALLDRRFDAYGRLHAALHDFWRA